MKICSLCKKEKPYSDFYKKSSKEVDKRRSRCIECCTNGLPPGPVPVSPLERYKINENGCWIWTGAIHKSGYGQMKWKGQSTVAHRVLYSVLVGEIPKGFVIDHLCNVKLCVNPEHLEAVTPSVNTQRAWNRQHCSTCSCNLI